MSACSRCGEGEVGRSGYCRPCKSAWQREYRNRVAAGEPSIRRMDLRDRIRRKVAVSPSGCWEWTGATSGKGYGYLRIGGKANYAHRVAYEAFVCPIPDGLVIDHLCRNTVCCNPEHLEAVENSVNVKRGLRGDLRVRAG